MKKRVNEDKKNLNLQTFKRRKRDKKENIVKDKLYLISNNDNDLLLFKFISLLNVKKLLIIVNIIYNKLFRKYNVISYIYLF